MNDIDPNKLTFLLQITNATDSTFWLEDSSPKHPPLTRIDKILPYQTVFIMFEGDPHLKQDIVIDYDIKKEVFSTYVCYTNYKQKVQFDTTLSYCYRQMAGHRPPKVELFWDTNAFSIGAEPINCGAALENENPVYPYSYKMIAFMTPSA
ncbi:hypothetical protein NJC08_24970 [Pseudomonas fluorescens]|uniref:hypothetical protein n=1 Tax=Pseudomonas fluorescens TaxID=294 RepID=UPI00209A771B|nr:hypothetical protein [Pseudomonas fluorescens]MCO7629682.1 hypothetical protein [Pseudomonas fluorescens]